MMLDASGGEPRECAWHRVHKPQIFLRIFLNAPEYSQNISTQC